MTDPKEVAAYVARCREMSEDGKYTWWSGLATALQSLSSELERVKGERDAQIDALAAKVDALAPHGTCGCSYDTPDDLCMHHSPKLARAEASLGVAETEIICLSKRVADLEASIQAKGE
jgi:hypothetical protein